MFKVYLVYKKNKIKNDHDHDESDLILHYTDVCIAGGRGFESRPSRL